MFSNDFNYIRESLFLKYPSNDPIVYWFFSQTYTPTLSESLNHHCISITTRDSFMWRGGPKLSRSGNGLGLKGNQTWTTPIRGRFYKTHLGYRAGSVFISLTRLVIIPVNFIAHCPLVNIALIGILWIMYCLRVFF